MLFLIYIYYIRFVFFCETSLIKYGANIYYIYIGIIVLNLLVSVTCLGIVEIGILTNYISGNSSSLETYETKIILKISQDNPDLVHGEIKTLESKNKIDLVDVKDNKDEGKKENFNVVLGDIHKHFFKADKSHCPSYFQKNVFPKISEDAPVYPNKIVTFKPSLLLQNRNLPEMSIRMPEPENTSIGKLTELNKAISGADEAIKLYDSQYIKFNKVLSGINNGTEEFYPKEAKPLMVTYIDFVQILSNQQKIMANEAINNLQKLDPQFSRGLYSVAVDNSGNAVSDTSISRVGGTRSGGTMEG